MSFILVIFNLIILLQLTTDLYLPSMPMIGVYFHVSNHAVQVSLSSFVAGMAISHLIFGPISDKFGRKVPLMSGVLISIIGSIVCFKAETVCIFISGRFFQGLGIGCVNSVGRSCVRDKFHGVALAKIGSIVGMLSIIIMIASPTLGGYVAEHYGWRTNFALLIAAGVFVLGLMTFYLPDTNQYKNQQALTIRYFWDTVLVLIRNKIFISYTLASCLAAGGVVAWFTLSAYILKEAFQLTPVSIGLQNLYIAAAVFCSSLINIALLDTIGIKHMVLLGGLCMAFAGTILLFLIRLDLFTLVHLMMAMSLFATGCGLVFINAFAGAFEPVSKIAGMAGMVYALFQDGFASLTSFFVAREGYNNIQTLAILFIITGMIALILVNKTPGEFHLNKD